MANQYWLLRAKANDKNRINDFLSNGIVGIGWNDTGNLKKKNIDEIKDIVAKVYSLSGVALGSTYGIINTFVNKINTDDILLVPDENDIYFANVKSDYKFDNNKTDYPHYREVEWCNNSKPIHRTDLPKELKNSLKVAKTIANLNHHGDIILTLAKGEEILIPRKDEAFVDVEYQIRLDSKVKIRMPKDLTSFEISRLADFVKTLCFNQYKEEGDFMENNSGCPICKGFKEYLLVNNSTQYNGEYPAILYRVDAYIGNSMVKIASCEFCSEITKNRSETELKLAKDNFIEAMAANGYFIRAFNPNDPARNFYYTKVKPFMQK
jgi:hypothetical protein